MSHTLWGFSIGWWEHVCNPYELYEFFHLFLSDFYFSHNYVPILTQSRPQVNPLQFFGVLSPDFYSALWNLLLLASANSVLTPQLKETTASVCYLSLGCSLQTLQEVSWGSHAPFPLWSMSCIVCWPISENHFFFFMYFVQFLEVCIHFLGLL